MTRRRILTLHLESRGCVVCHIWLCRKVEDTTGTLYIDLLCDSIEHVLNEYPVHVW